MDLFQRRAEVIAAFQAIERKKRPVDKTPPNAARKIVSFCVKQDILEVTCQPVGESTGQAWWDAKPRDISVQGIAMVTTCPIELGGIVTIKMQNKTKKVP